MMITVPYDVYVKAMSELYDGTFDPSNLPEEQSYAIACEWRKIRVHAEHKRLLENPGKDILSSARAGGLSEGAILKIVVTSFALFVAAILSVVLSLALSDKTILPEKMIGSFIFASGTMSLVFAFFGLEAATRKEKKALALAEEAVNSALPEALKKILKETRPVEVRCDF